MTQSGATSDGMPSGTDIADAYDRLLDLADDQLERPLSTKIRSWDDGEFEIRVWHKGSHPDADAYARTVLRYHNTDDGVVKARFKYDAETRERVAVESMTDLGPLDNALAGAVG